MPKEATQSIEDQIIHVGSTANQKLKAFNEERHSKSNECTFPPLGLVHQKTGKKAKGQEHENISWEIDPYRIP